MDDGDINRNSLFHTILNQYKTHWNKCVYDQGDYFEEN